MIYKDDLRLLSDEQKARYILSLCELCKFYDNCELVNDYLVEQIQKNKTSPPVKAYSLTANGKATPIKVIPKAIVLNPENNSIKQNAFLNLPFYMREVWESGICPMKGINQIECGSQWVSNGIGNDFKIDLTRDYMKGKYKIDESFYKTSSRYMTKKWEPRQPVFISAPTGGGKNTFAEQDVPKYIRELNHRHKTNHRILIFSNRRAHTEQSKDRLARGMVEDDTVYYNYGDYVDVMPYHSLLGQVEYLKRVQQGSSQYLYVFCDEAHFFAADSSFNPDTEKILETIIDIFSKAIRIYMTATPYDCFKFIRDKESKRDKHISEVIYHFKRDYCYLNTKYFSDEAELIDIITNSVVTKNERWLIFIDNTKRITALKNLLEYRDGEPTALKGRVMAVDAERKYKDMSYQEMIVSEKFIKGINVVISTSVIDNGINFWNVDNVVITDTNRTKCLQMAGRARVKKDPVTKAPLSKVTLYIKRHDASFISKRLAATGIQQDAYHDHDMLLQTKYDKWRFLNKYKDSEQADWENSNHWFGRDRREPNKLYPNNIARSLADKNVRVYESILEEMDSTDKGKKVAGQKFLEYQLSWFGKKYSKKNDITLSGYKTDGQLGFEKWIHAEWLGKKIPKEAQKDFGKDFFARYNPVFGLCTKKQGFGTDDNRTEKGPRTAGYSIKRIMEIFQVRKMPFKIIEDDGYCLIVHV